LRSFAKTARMIPIGQHQELTILRHTSVGLFLGDEAGEEDVLLPNKYAPKNLRSEISLPFLYTVIMTNGK
jgi:predicted RNA-binding protein (virulence factor B family)